MFNQISPELLRVIQKEKELAMEQQIKQIRIAKEQRLAMGGSLAPRRAWYAQAVQWMQAKLFKRASQPELITKPCPGTPC